MRASSTAAVGSGEPGSQAACPLCEVGTRRYLFSREGLQFFRCANCGLARVEGQAPAQPPGRQVPEIQVQAASASDRRVDACIAALSRRGASRSRVLAITEAAHPFLAAATAQGYDVGARMNIHAVERDAIAGGPYETAVVLFQLEKAANPVSALERIHRALAPGATLLVVTPSLDGLPVGLLRNPWPDSMIGTRSYFDLQTIQSCCLRGGFAELEWTEPRAFTRQQSASGMIVTARRVQPPPRPLLSVVMPVYNERATFERTLQAVLAKTCPGVDKEVVIVESRSTDGTRELVEQYESHPAVTVIYQDRPEGKGAAVRAGLVRAKGTIVLIQDADDEYDVEDYDALLEPILSYRNAFVLGSRHMGSWKVRHFADQPAVSAFFNFGHVLFRTALNVLYRQKLNDPFTMYKVFRRDCLHRLKLECNRFDFDFELVIKLLRKGYVPLEVPVNYASRSFSEGKKVSAFRDPVTWLRALARFRFGSIYEE